MSTLPCIVCRRARGEIMIVDGLRLVLCDECEADDFTLAEAVRRARSERGAA